jgi:hypothetical protein
MEVTLKQNDTKVKFKDVLKLNGVRIPLNGCAVRFLMKQLYERTPKTVEEDATFISQVTDPNNQTPDTGCGCVEYESAIDATDLDTMGDFRQEWEVTFTDDRVLTFPNGSWNLVHVISDLGPADVV